MGFPSVFGAREIPKTDFQKSLTAQPKSIMDQLGTPGGILAGSLTAAIAEAILKPEPKKNESGESNRINKMLDLGSRQKIGAYAAAPPGYMQMVKASLQTEKHVASIDKKTPAHVAPSTRF
jgi:hypothetical protein